MSVTAGRGLRVSPSRAHLTKAFLLFNIYLILPYLTANSLGETATIEGDYANHGTHRYAELAVMVYCHLCALHHSDDGGADFDEMDYVSFIRCFGVDAYILYICAHVSVFYLYDYLVCNQHYNVHDHPVPSALFQLLAISNVGNSV